MNADDYLAAIRACVLTDPLIVNCQVMRERSEGDAGQYRYRLGLEDGSLLEAFEWFEKTLTGTTATTKYSFHWQTAPGNLIARWDNAPHHPEIDNAPHHVHEGEEGNVLSGSATTLPEILRLIRLRINS